MNELPTGSWGLNAPQRVGLSLGDRLSTHMEGKYEIQLLWNVMDHSTKNTSEFNPMMPIFLSQPSPAKPVLMNYSHPLMGRVDKGPQWKEATSVPRLVFAGV